VAKVWGFEVAARLHPSALVKRLFLSAPTTCALLLGAGLLLRAQAMLRAEPPPDTRVVQKAGKTVPLEVGQADAPEKARARQAAGRRAIRGDSGVERRSQARNAKGQRTRRTRRSPRHAQKADAGERGGGREGA
jgi:hypothetical protein